MLYIVRALPGPSLRDPKKGGTTMKAFTAVAAALVLTVAVSGCHRAKPAPKPTTVVKVVEK